MASSLSIAKSAVCKKSEELPETTPIVKGYDWNSGINYPKLLNSYKTCGFQATNYGLAVEEINNMLKTRSIKLSQERLNSFDEGDEYSTPETNCTIFLGYTSNMISSGLRDTIRFLVQHKLVDCIVTTAGGVEEDFIKCLAPTYLGDFYLDGKTLRDKGINRIGNLLIPNENYCLFEDWISPKLDKMVEEQNEKKVVWSPSKIIQRLGEEINDETSVYYWAAKNKIPVLCPALTDGSIGDMMYFHSYKNPGLVVDILSDLKVINTIARKAINSGIIILGSGLVKHHICNANLMRNGSDFAVFVNTSSEFDGSDSGARPDEAISWGKIKKTAKPVKDGKIAIASRVTLFIGFPGFHVIDKTTLRTMVCVSCFVWPILLFIWYKFVHPFILKFWNPKKICNEKSNVTSENGENENNINKCHFDKIMNREQQIHTSTGSEKKDE